jgi:D-alanine-D-alanine ligase
MNGMPLQRIGILYLTSSQSSICRGVEKQADLEVVDVAQAVQDVLVEMGYLADLINLDPRRIGDLQSYDWIFNLAETIDCFPLTDYEIAELMERLHISFTGSGSQTLKTCLDKGQTKDALRRHGIATPDYQVIAPGEIVRATCPFPLIVKPVHEDGSIGIDRESIVWNPDDLSERVERIHHIYRQAALVEEFIVGREISVSILGNNGDMRALPPSEIVFPGQDGTQFLTFHAKWIPESAEFAAAESRCPCDLDSKVERFLMETAMRACRVMGCQDYARVDFRLKEGVAYVLEVNPNPCINPQGSGFVGAVNALGWDYKEMISRILEVSYLREAEQEGKRMSLSQGSGY